MITIEQKYADPTVVAFWQRLARQGLQQAEMVMVRRYLPPGGHLLDLGCGVGRASLALQPEGFRVTGIDVSLPMLRAGRNLSVDMRLAGANLRTLPFADEKFSAALMFFGALQHVPNQRQRQQALTEMGRVVEPGGRLILGLDNLAPTLTCYAYWLGQRIASSQLPITNCGLTSPTSPDSPTTDSILWQRRANLLVWHGRGLLRSLRWRTWPGLVDACRRICGFGLAVGDVNVAQFSQPATPGRVYYHIYRPGELIAEAAAAGWRLVGFHAGSELAAHKTYPPPIRGLDKQLFFAFEK